MDYEDICEDFIRACRTMRDEKRIREWYELLKDFSEEELEDECELCTGEAIRARGIVYQVGLYFAEKDATERAGIKEDIMAAVDDFYNY